MNLRIDVTYTTSDGRQIYESHKWEGDAWPSFIWLVGREYRLRPPLRSLPPEVDPTSTITCRRYLREALNKSPRGPQLMIFSRMAQNRYIKERGHLPYQTNEGNTKGGGRVNLYILPDDLPILEATLADYRQKGYLRK